MNIVNMRSDSVPSDMEQQLFAFVQGTYNNASKTHIFACMFVVPRRGGVTDDYIQYGHGNYYPSDDGLGGLCIGAALATVTALMNKFNYLTVYFEDKSTVQIFEHAEDSTRGCLKDFCQLLDKLQNFVCVDFAEGKFWGQGMQEMLDKAVRNDGLWMDYPLTNLLNIFKMHRVLWELIPAQTLSTYHKADVVFRSEKCSSAEQNLTLPDFIELLDTEDSLEFTGDQKKRIANYLKALRLYQGIGTPMECAAAMDADRDTLQVARMEQYMRGKHATLSAAAVDDESVKYYGHFKSLDLNPNGSLAIVCSIDEQTSGKSGKPADVGRTSRWVSVKKELPPVNTLVKVKLSNGLERYDYVNFPVDEDVPFAHYLVTKWKYPDPKELFRAVYCVGTPESKFYSANV